MPGKLGWTCSRCTFEHHAPGTRCVMCNELRTTKQHMIDFVQGKPIPESLKVNTATVTAVVDPLREKGTENKNKQSVAAATAKRKEPQRGKSPEKQPQKKRQATSHYFTRPKESASCSNASATSVSVRNPYTSAASRMPPANSSVAARSGNFLRTQLQNTGNASNSNPNDNDNLNANQNNHDSNRNQLDSNRISTDNKHHPNNAIHNNANAQINYQRQLPQKQLQNHNENWNPQRQTANQKKPPAFLKTAGQRSSNSSFNRDNNSGRRPPYNNGIPLNNVSNNLSIHRKPPIIAHYVPGPVPLDESTLAEWVYPKDPNFARREYQVEISRSALFQNTLVSLPTGLGKTLIAAVVMYNYYRWFPTGKLIFCAPTNPLVSQQAVAVCKLIGIPATDAAVMTGRIPHHARKQIWKERRVFFCTPQTVQKDFERSEDITASQVVCLVLDEAHKTTGDYAYVNVVELLEKANAKFRIVGLSATPGSTLDGIQKIVTNLRIAKIEFRQEEDPSIAEHTHSRDSEVVVVKEPDVVKAVRDRLVKLLITPYLRKVQENGLLTNVRDGSKVSKVNVVKAQDQLRSAPGKFNPSMPSYLGLVMNVIIWRDCLGSHGIGLFCSKVLEFMRKPKTGVLSAMAKSDEFKEILTMAQDASTNAEGNVDNKKLLEQNPKLLKLKEILDEHFERARILDVRERAQGSQKPATLSSTRAIVFSQLRDSVTEIVHHLEASRPLVRAHRFVGQSKGSSSGKKDDEGNDQNDGLKGMNQKEQHKVIKEFREGKYNVLVCTCIGEEGLDIGEVDLIINFDTPMSPIRSLQRVGRTGRKRDGRVVVLLTEKEEMKHKKAKASELTLSRALNNSSKFHVVPSAPMFPTGRPLPVMSEREGLNHADFRLTQVTGLCSSAQKKRRRSSKSGLSPKKRNSDFCGRWKLTDDEERERSQFLGGEVSVPCSADRDQSDLGFPASVRKRLLKARTMTLAAQTPVDLSRYPLGSTLKLLRTFQESHGKRYDPSRVPLPTRVSSRESKSAQLVFPFLEKVTAATTTLRSFSDKYQNSGNSCEGLHKGSRSFLPMCDFPQHTIDEYGGAETRPSLNASRSHHCNTSSAGQSANHSNRGVHAPETTTSAFNHRDQESVAPAMRPAPLNPYKKKTGNNNSTDSVIATKSSEPERPSEDPVDITSKNTAMPNVAPQTAIPGNDSVKPNHPTNPYASTSRQKVVRSSRANEQDGPPVNPCNMVTGSLTDNAVLGDPLEPAFAKSNNGPKVAVDNFALPIPHQHDANRKSIISAQNEGPFQEEEEADEFCLPPPEQSSSEDDSDGNDSDEDALEDQGVVGGRQNVSEQTALRQQNTHFAGERQELQESRGSLGSCAGPPMKVVIENMPTVDDDATGIADRLKEGNKDKSISEDSQPLRLPTQSSTSSDAQDSQSLRLPTQDSSSSSSDDESSSGSVQCDDRDFSTAAHQAPTKPQSVPHCVEVKQDSLLEKLPSSAPSVTKPETILQEKHESMAQFNVEVGDSDDMPLIALRNDRVTCESVKSGEQHRQKQTILEEQQSDTENVNLCDLTSEDTERVFLKRKNRKKTVDLFLSQGDSLNTQRVEAKTPRNTNIAANSPLLLVDTPHDNTAKKQGVQDGLTDTPIENENGCSIDDIDNIVCAICFSGECHDDPIILCDGAGAQENNSCSLAVHQSCYQVNPEQLDRVEAWRCDPCSIRYKVRVTKEIADYDFGRLSCYICSKREGPLRKLSQNVWSHPYCKQWSSVSDNIPCSLCSLKGAVQCGAQHCSAAIHPHCALTSYAKSCQESWTFVEVAFPPAHEHVGDDALSILFCPKDSKESHDFIQQYSDAVGNANTQGLKLKVIPPQGPSSIGEASVEKIQSGVAAGQKLRKMGTAAATKKNSRPPVPPRKRQGNRAPIVPDGDELKPSPVDAEERQARKRARLERRKLAKRFFDEEADIGSDDDGYGDEDEARDLANLEADELSSSSFINDSSQLGYTQDELDRVDPTQANSATPALDGVNDDGMHRRMDNERTRQIQYTTPVLNRKMRRNSLTPANAPESERGLGKMHFIRSVLEHHKNGGDADQIEEVYHQVEQEKSEPPSNKFVSFRNPRDDEDENLVPSFDYGF